MNSEQKKHLNDRLTAARRAKDVRYEHTPDSAKPANVRNAERIAKAHQRIVDQWSKRLDSKRQAAYKRMYKASESVKELILFGDPAKALVALAAFESRNFK